jgi:GNAT superfamily N-acetyltransferase
MDLRDFLFDPTLIDAFIGLPLRLHAGDPMWVPQSHGTERAQLSPANPFFAHGTARFWLALGADGLPVGRLGAMLDRRFTADGVPVGFVGFFESVDDQAVASALLDAASAWLRAQGAKKVWGPINFSIFNRYRFVTKGFELERFLGEMYNPAYYPALFERYGFTPREGSASWDLSPEHLAEITSKIEASGREAEVLAMGYKFRQIDMERFDEEFKLFYELTVEGFGGHTGYIPITYEEFAFSNGGSRLFLEPRMVHFTLAPGGTPCGLGYGYLNQAPLLRALGEDVSPGRALALGPAHPPREMVFHTIVVAKEHRLRGLALGLLLRLAEGGRKAGLDRAIGGFAKIDIGSLFEKVYSVAPRSREYTLYQKAL